MQTAIKHYPLTTNQSEMFQEWEEDTKMTQFNNYRLSIVRVVRVVKVVKLKMKSLSEL